MNDERLILFHQRPTPLTLDSLKRFRAAGIRTVELDARWASWHEIQPEPDVYDWSVTDKVVDRCCQAGLRVILGLYWRAPDWLDGCIDVVRSAGTGHIGPDRTFPDSWRAINPFKEEALAAEIKFLEVACKRYAKVNVVPRYAMHYGAERVLPFGLWPYTEQQCIDVVLARQRVFAQYADELWTSFHPNFESGLKGSVDQSTHPHVGNEHIKAIYAAMGEEFLDHSLNQFITEVFVAGGPWDISLEGVRVWAGAQFTTGVVANAKRIYGCGGYGLIMAHQGIVTDNQQPTPDAYERTRAAIDILKRGVER